LKVPFFITPRGQTQHFAYITIFVMEQFWEPAGVMALTRGLQICYLPRAQNIV